MTRLDAAGPPAVAVGPARDRVPLGMSGLTMLSGLLGLATIARILGQHRAARRRSAQPAAPVPGMGGSGFLERTRPE